MPFELVGQREARARLRHRGVVPQGRGITPPGLGQMADGAVNVSQVIVGLGHCRFEGDCGLAMGERIVRTAQVDQKLAQVIPRRRELGGQFGGSSHVHEGLVFFAEFTQGGPKVGVGHWIVRF